MERRRIAVAILLVYVLAVLGHQALGRRKRPPRAETPWLDTGQVAALRRELGERGVVGFLSPPTDVPTEAWRNRGPDYFWTQLDLAPLVLVPGAAPPLVLVNARDPDVARALGAREGLRVKKDLGGGLVVFEHGP